MLMGTSCSIHVKLKETGQLGDLGMNERMKLNQILKKEGMTN
jgi:hypothetical protein